MGIWQLQIWNQLALYRFLFSLFFKVTLNAYGYIIRTQVYILTG